MSQQLCETLVLSVVIWRMGNKKKIQSECWLMIKPGYILMIVIVSILTGCDSPAGKNAGDADLLQQRAVEQLQLNLRTQPRLVKAHAAEFLLWLGLDNQGEVHKIFINENEHFATESPYRIPLWRVLAQTENDPKDKQVWIDKILQAWLDSTATDRAGAAESLSKLKVSVLKLYPELTTQIVNGEKNPFSAYTFWSASNGITSEDSIRRNRAEYMKLLAHENDHIKGLAAYSLRHLGKLTDNEWRQLAEAALVKLGKPEFQVYMISAAFVLTPDSALSTPLYADIRRELLQNKISTRKDDRMELAAALALKGNKDDVPVLDSLLSNKYPVVSNADTALASADIRSVAAYAIIKIARRYDQKRE